MGKNMAPSAPLPPLPSEIYAVFNGPLDQEAVTLRQGAFFPYSSGTKYRKDRIYRATRTVVHIRYVRVIAAETIPEAFGPQSSGSLTTVSANDYQSPA
jgi:hypothetical protein